MVKIITVLIAIQYFIFLFTIKDKSVRLLVRKSMHLLINNCCGTRFHLFHVVLSSFIRHNTTELFYFSAALEISNGTQQNS